MADWYDRASAMYNSFVVVRSKDDSDAVVRLQSDPVLRGLRNHPTISAHLMDPHRAFEIKDGSCVLFHFDETAAIERLKQARRSKARFTSVCFGCDIYSFARYLPSYEIADMYLMPTELHRQVLASQFYKPVYCLAECIDPLAGVKEGSPPLFPSKRSRKVLWFGYSGSFDKGMASLVPVVKMHRKAGHISDFTLILDEEEFLNEFRLPTIPFRKESFRSDAGAFDYCILSHFSLDLSLNSYIKSPNKLITALMVGLIPIASNTPNYRAILTEFGLERFLFDSASDLDRILRSLDPDSDSRQIADSGIIETLVARYSESRLVESLLEIMSEFEALDTSSLLGLNPRLMSTSAEKASVSFTGHLRGLLPSFRRSVKQRWRQHRG